MGTNYFTVVSSPCMKNTRVDDDDVKLTMHDFPWVPVGRCRNRVMNEYHSISKRTHAVFLTPPTGGKHWTWPKSNRTNCMLVLPAHTRPGFLTRRLPLVHSFSIASGTQFDVDLCQPRRRRRSLLPLSNARCNTTTTVTRQIRGYNTHFKKLFISWNRNLWLPGDVNHIDDNCALSLSR